MPLRTAEEYRAGLRDKRVVYKQGRRVDDVTVDPHIEVGVETAALDFDFAEENPDLATAPHPKTGDVMSAYFKLPDSPEAVGARYKLVLGASRFADAALPFVKDVGTDILNGLAAVTRIVGDPEYIRRLDDYRWDCASRDVAMAGCVTDPKGDRSKSPSEQPNPDAYLRVVDETADHIVVRGAKAHITAGPYVDELLVVPTRNLTAAEADYAVAFSIPVATDGITQIVRPSFPADDPDLFPQARARRGHLESLVIFDDVVVPKERVFLQGEFQAAQYVAYSFSAFHRFTAVTYKIPILEYMAGLGLLAAEANGIAKASHVKEHVVQMIRYVETTKALARSAIIEPDNFGGSGLFVADRLASNMAKLHFASGFHEFVRRLQDIAGGILVTQPTHADWQNDELRPYLQQYLGGAPGWDAETRMKLLSCMQHVIASDFSGWHEVCTIHAEGSMAACKKMLLSEAPTKAYKAHARDLVGLEAK